MNNLPLQFSQESIVAFCDKWKVTEFALFGSVLREDFGPQSDIDVLLSFSPDAQWGLFERVEMQDDLEAIFGRKVDVVNRQGIEQSHNDSRRNAILQSARVIHAA